MTLVSLSASGVRGLRDMLRGKPRRRRVRVAPVVDGQPTPAAAIRVFVALQDWTANATFPARLQRWDGSAWQTADAGDIQVRDFQGFPGKAGARGFAINLYGVWWHITSTCPS